MILFEFYLFFIQQILISYPFYTHQCIHVNPNLPIHPPPLSPLGVHTFVLYIWVSLSALQIGSSVPCNLKKLHSNEDVLADPTSKEV